MPLPKALQAALDSTPTPSSDNVFDFEAGNKVVKPADPAPVPDIDTSKDNWMDDLLNDSDASTDDEGGSVDDMFITDTDGEGSFPDIAAEPEGNKQFDELKDIITALEGKINKSDTDDAQKKLLDDSLAALKEKYGTVDQDILDNFSELHNTFKATIGQELETEMVKNKLINDQKIAELEAKIESLSSPSNPIPADSADPTDYRNLMAEAVPEYLKIIGSSQFKQLMNTPVDADNPEFTYNQKLGKLYGQRRTADILKFFSSFADKYMAGGKGNGAVVDSGKSSSSQGGQGKQSLSPDRLRSIFEKVMKGELTLSEADMLKLRTMAAKQTMD